MTMFRTISQQHDAECQRAHYPVTMPSTVVCLTAPPPAIAHSREEKESQLRLALSACEVHLSASPLREAHLCQRAPATATKQHTAVLQLCLPSQGVPRALTQCTRLRGSYLLWLQRCMLLMQWHLLWLSWAALLAVQAAASLHVHLLCLAACFWLVWLCCCNDCERL